MRLFASMADHARPTCLQNSFLVRGRALVVLLAPGKVPEGGDEEESSKHHRRVVHELGRDGNRRRHGEERDGEGRPGYHVSAMLWSTTCHKTHLAQQRCRTCPGLRDGKRPP
jgi:hypothetical protein